MASSSIIDDRLRVFFLFGQARALGDNGGVTPAFAAASNGHHKLVRLLAAHAADLDAAPRSGPDAGQSPLWHAAYFNAVAVVEALATSGADLNFRFRHASRVGSVIADLVTQGNSNLPIEPFRIDRFDNTEETPQ